MGQGAGGGEGIYSTVIEKGRLMCKYIEDRLAEGWSQKRESAFELLPQTVPGVMS